jgi:Caspase domain
MADRLAVIVGINKYWDPDIKELQGAVRDAEEIRESLEGPGGFTILHSLIGPDATSENIRRSLYDLLWKSCDPCELVLFYFSGHGVLDGHREPYLAPYDINSKELLVRGIKMLELKQLLLESRNRDNAILVLDCCHSGMIASGSNRGAGDASPPLYDGLREQEIRKDEEAVQQPAKGTGKFILASAGPNEKAREQEFSHRIRKEGDKPHYHGLFTFHLLEALNGEAAESDNEVYLPRLQDYLSGRMAKYKDHDAYYFGFGKGPQQKIRLVTACRKQEIEQWLQEVEDEIGESDHGRS